MKTRSVLECGSPLPLSHGSGVKSAIQSARGLAQSKTWRLWLTALCLLTAVLRPLTQAQSYSIDPFTIDGGGGTSTGGVYQVSGTVGQPDANHQPMTGGNYSLVGGFWSLFAVQTPGAPLLSITRTTTNTVTVSWPSPSLNWTLQQNTNGVGSVNWSNVTSGVTDNGTLKYLIVNPPTGNRFYRLFTP